MKRSRESSDDEILPMRPAKRFSMMDNTPQQWKEERRHILRLAKQKLRQLDNPLRDLQKSVLINNTSRRMKRELQERGANKYRGYKRNHAQLPYHRGALFRAKEDARESEVSELSTPSTDSTNVSEIQCGDSCEVSGRDLEISANVDSGVIEVTDSEVSQEQCRDSSSCDMQTVNTSPSQEPISCGGPSTGTSCDDCGNTNMDTSSHFRSRVPDRAEHCGNAMGAEWHSEPRLMESDYTGSSHAHRDGLTDSQSHANDSNYTPLRTYSQHPTSQDASSSDFAYTNTTSGVYTPYDLLYKQYCMYPGYLPSLHHPFGMHNQFLFSLTELLRNNCSYPTSECGNRDHIYATNCLNNERETFASASSMDSENEETYVDILT